jgi:flagellar biosynthetic protein FliR
VEFHFVEAIGAAAPMQAYAVLTLLLAIRLGAMLLLTPVLYAFEVPTVVRVLVVFGLAAALASGSPPRDGGEVLAGGAGALLAASFRELALGGLLGLAVLAAFAAISMAGRLMDLQIGFGMAQVLDPVTRREVPVISAAFDRLGAIVFILLSGPQALLRGIAFSIERFPVGRPWSLQAASPAVFNQVAAVFGLALSLAAPVMLGLLMVELGLGVLSRNLPQINMFVVGAPVKIVAGLAALAFWFGGFAGALDRVYASIYRTWDAAIAAPAKGVR